MIDCNVVVTVEDVGDLEPGFYRAHVTWSAPERAVVYASGYGRGQERAVASAMARLGEELLKEFPEDWEAAG